MNLPKRPGQAPRPFARVWLSRRAAAAITAVALAGFAFGTAPAMTRSSRVHPHSIVVVDPEPIPSRHHASHKKTAAAHPASTHHTVAASRGKASSHENARELHTASRHASPRESRIEPRTGHTARVNIAAKKTIVREPAPHNQTPAKEIATTKPAPAKPHTSDDFLRAAGVAAAPTPPKAYAEGVSQPQEMDDSKPLPQVSANNVPAKPAAPAAEGTPTHRTLARTMALHHTEQPSDKATDDAPASTPSFEQEALTDDAVKPVVLPALYTRGGRLIMPQPLRGSREILVHQNEMATQEGLRRIRDDDELNQIRAAHKLVRLPETASLDVNDELPVERRYALPWTVRFAVETARAYSSRFGEPIRINSAVRTVSYQVRLMRVNGNAADINGETASPHLTGQAIDIGKHGMTEAEIAWMRNYLLPLMQAGKIDVEEEFQQACFHISVYRGYTDTPRKATKLEVASRHDEAR